MPPDSLRELKARLAQCNLRSSEVRGLLRRHVLTEKERLSTSCPDLGGCLEAAAMLVEAVGHVEGEEGEELKGLLTRLVDVVAEARERRAAKDPASGEPTDGLGVLNGMALGEVLVQLGFLGTADVDDALRLATESGRALGEVLVERGALESADLEHALALQRSLARPQDDAPGARPHAVHHVLLGELLVARGAISREGLERGLAHQRASGMRLGESLVRLELLSPAALQEAIDAQGALG